MLNSSQFSNRLKKIMDYYELSAAAFSEKIAVQRSSISHILSGRNKPSLEFIMKLLKVFPEVDLYWLLNGKGSFPKTATKESTSLPTTPPIQDSEEGRTVTHDDIDRIVVFFKNGTFKNYKP